jgi:2-hydroxy-3-keto-5-methylthiopentenyl-1-phosphate phosphatase
MRKILLSITLLLCAPVFAANKTNPYLTHKDFMGFAGNLQAQINKANKSQRDGLQRALDKIQADTQKQINLLEKQIRTLSEQTATAVKAINEKLARLKGKKTPHSS